MDTTKKDEENQKKEQIEENENQQTGEEAKKKKKKKNKNKNKEQDTEEQSSEQITEEKPAEKSAEKPKESEQPNTTDKQDMEEEKQEGEDNAEKKKKKKKKNKNKNKEGQEEGEQGEVQNVQEEEKKEIEEGEGEEVEGEDGEKKKKKKKPKKKKNQEEAMEKACPIYDIQFAERHERLHPDLMQRVRSKAQDNSIIRNLGSWKEGNYNQTNPPIVPVEKQFPQENWPLGTKMDYKGSQSYRTKDQEMRERDKIHEDQLQHLRKAAECQRQTRKWAQQIARPGKRLIDICEEIEELNRYLIQENGLEAGIAFPTGCSLNHVAAHYTPNNGDLTVLGEDDVCKIDFGTQVQGRIIDTAFTVAFNPKFDKLLEAVKDATYAGIQAAGIDARFNEIGGAIQEAMESYEVDLNGKTHQVKVVRNLNGHSIDPYKIHGGKSVPCIKEAAGTKMEEGEQYAIETFGVINGKGQVWEEGECSHYMKNWDQGFVPLKYPKAKQLLKHINETFSTLAFCRRWLDRAGQTGHIMALKQLCDAQIINTYPPLTDKVGSYVAQYEHTLFLKPSGKEIFSMGDDY